MPLYSAEPIELVLSDHDENPTTWTFTYTGNDDPEQAIRRAVVAYVAHLDADQGDKPTSMGAALEAMMEDDSRDHWTDHGLSRSDLALPYLVNWEWYDNITT